MNKTSEWGKEVINKALEYANYEWYATDKILNMELIIKE